jgi:hypothetical protein
MLMPSETEMVVNARGVPPAATTPSCARRLLGKRAVARRRVAGGGDDADERPRHGGIVEPHAAHERPVRRTIDAVGSDARAERRGRQALASLVVAEGEVRNQQDYVSRIVAGFSRLVHTDANIASLQKRYTRQPRPDWKSLATL